MSEDEQRLSQELASLHIRRDEPSSTRSGGFGRWIAVLIVIALGAGAAWFFTHRSETQLFSEEVEIGVVTLVSPTQEEVTLVATGYVSSRKKATVAPKIQGRLAKLLVDEGDAVKEGQLIAELESAEPQAQIAQVRADVASARARVERAKADLAEAETKLAREQKLVAGAAGTQAAVDDAKSRAVAARAAVAAAEAEVAAFQARARPFEVQLDNTKVKAPFDATVIRKLAEVGEVVTPGGTGLVTIASLADLEVQADVNEAQLSKVKAGTPAEILLDAFPDRRFAGRVREIRQTVDRAKATVTVKVKFDGDTQGVLPDMAAKCNFRDKPLEDADKKVAPKLVAPSDAIVDRGGRKVLLTVEEGKVREVPVITGGAVGHAAVELTSSPVPSGTRVVRHPAATLHEGSAVKEKDKK